jgi:hypothetical protein
MGSTHQINCMFTVDNHVSLKTQAFEEFRLSFRASLGHSYDGFRFDSVDSGLELFDFYLNEFAFALDFKLEFIFG